MVINEAKGDKYNFAKLWKISIVNSKWIYDSIEAMYCLPEKVYQLNASASTSTPTNNNNNKSVLGSKVKSNKLDIDISMIANTTTRNMVNETEADHRMSYSQDNTTFSVPTSLSKHGDILKELNTIGKIKSILFDGFGVSLFFYYLEYWNFVKIRFFFLKKYPHTRPQKLFSGGLYT